jgi:hypothetical protein
MHKRGIPFEVKTQYDTVDVFVGVSLAVDPQDAHQLGAIPGVKAVHPVVTIPAPEYVDGPISFYSILPFM